jgi:hypothetical protein
MISKYKQVFNTCNKKPQKTTKIFLMIPGTINQVKKLKPKKNEKLQKRPGA